MQYRYWPPGVPRVATIEAFIQAFETVGFVRCEGPEPVEGLEKVAIYIKDGRPTHAAFHPTERGWWGSKLGPYHDIEHRTAHGVGGAQYGEPAVYMSRPPPNPARPQMPNTVGTKSKAR